jgi:hypothetical protein
MPTFTPTELRSLLFGNLDEPQQLAAAGRFADSATIDESEVSRTVMYFIQDLPPPVRKISLISSKALLFTENRTFKIMSCPILVTDLDNREIILGHDGSSLLHPIPISISADEAVKGVKVLLFDSPDPDDPSPLHHLVAASPVTDTIVTSTLDADGAEVERVEHTFPFPHHVPDPETTFTDHYVAILPVMLPLPAGHGLDPVHFGAINDITTFVERLHQVAPHCAEWAKAMLHADMWWGGVSLQHPTANIPPAFSDGLDNNAPLRPTMFLPTTTVPPTSTGGKDLLARLHHVRNDNIDTWFRANPDTYDTLIAKYQGTPPAAGPPTPTLPPTTVVTSESRSDRIAAEQVRKAKVSTELLLSRPGTNADGAPIIVPGIIRSTFADAMQEPATRSFRTLEQLYRALIQGRNQDGAPDMYAHYWARFPYVMVNPAFAAAMFNAHWSTLPLQHGERAFGQNLTLLTFAPARPGTAEYTSQLEETNAILGEELVGAVPAHRTKARLQLFDGGVVLHYSHLMSTIANLILVLTAADDPAQATEATIIKDLRQVFQLLASHQVQLWLEHHTRTAHGEHLAYAIAQDIHNNCLIHIAQFALNATWIQASLEGTEIPASALDWYRSVHLSVIANIQKASMSDSLGAYQSPPSTWVSPKAAKEAKDQAKKAAKTSETSSPNSRAPRASNSNTSNQQSQPRSGGSNPELGILLAPDNIRNGPQLPSGKRLCLLFTVKGRTCPNGFSCAGSHLTPRNATLPELQSVDRWVANTPNVSWVFRPPALSAPGASNQPIPSPTPAPSPAAPVTPQTQPNAGTTAHG